MALSKISFTFLPFPLIKKTTLGTENSCFFHSFLQGCDEYYNSLATVKEKTTRARILRNLLADKLSEIDDSGKEVYYSLFRGEISSFAKEVGSHPDVLDYSLPGLQSLLRGDEMVDNFIQELLSDCIDVDIYILDEQKRDVYFTGVFPFDEENHLYKNRKSVVIGYNSSQSHFSTLGMMSLSGEVATFFDSDHILIELIKKRMLYFIQKGSEHS